MKSGFYGHLEKLPFRKTLGHGEIKNTHIPSSWNENSDFSRHPLIKCDKCEIYPVLHIRAADSLSYHVLFLFFFRQWYPLFSWAV